MDEQNKVTYCTQCGGENAAGSKFCKDCGTKLEQPYGCLTPEQQPQADNHTEEAQPVYEKVEAEVVMDGASGTYPQMNTQEEININYAPDTGSFNTNGSGYNDFNNSVNEGSGYKSTTQPQYYSTEIVGTKQINGKIGFSIAAMACGITSLLCCCLYVFSIVLAITAIVLGIVAIRNKYDGTGMAIAGISTGGVTIVLVVILLLAAGTGSFINNFMW